MPSVSFMGVTKMYSGSETKAVDNLTLEIPEGEFLCLLGPSGCGKTTTLRMLAGLERLSDGKITIGNQTIDDVAEGVSVPPEKRELGMVFQSYALWPHLTVEGNVEFGLRYAGSSKRASKPERVTKVREAMERTGINAYAARYPSELSGGQQQRVALARTLVTNPKVILMDEPLSNLDAKLRLEMRAELQRIHKEFGTTIVFVTHDQWEAMALATTIAVMNDGELQQVATPEGLYNSPKNKFVAEFVGSPPMNMFDDDSNRDQMTRILGDYFAAHQIQDRSSPFHSFGIRPETISVGPPSDKIAPDEIRVDVILESILPMGGSWILQVDIDGKKVFSTTTAKPESNAGDAVQLSVPAAAVLQFDENGQQISHPAQ